MADAINRKVNRKKIGADLVTPLAGVATVYDYIPQDDEVDGYPTPFVGVDSVDSDPRNLNTNFETGDFLYDILIMVRMDRINGDTAEDATDLVDDIEQIVRTYVKNNTAVSGYWGQLMIDGGTGTVTYITSGGTAYRTELIRIRTQYDCNI